MTNWNEEQLTIFHEVKTTQDNLMIEALAGGAKTTTLVELARYLDGPGIAVAFNKKIADELTPRLPSNVEARTLNSLGHRVWGQKLGKRLALSDGKCHKLLLEYIEGLPDDERSHLYETLGGCLNIIRGSKNHGHVPDSIFRELGDHCSPLLSDDEFFSFLPEEPTPVQTEAILFVLRESFRLALDDLS